MEIDKMTIGELKEIQALLSPKPTARKIKTLENGGFRIVVLQRGWVAVGKFSQVGDECKLSPAATIRVWGTSKGLGELVEGPTSSTKLDPAPEILFNESTSILMIPVKEEKWVNKI